MRKSNFIKKSVSFILVSVMMLAVITPITDAQVQAATDNFYNVAQYRNNGTEYTYPTDKAGYVFAGWYTDADYQTPLGADVTTGNAYAKFVSEDVLKLKCQLPVTVAETDETTALRLITSVDSLNYQYVGFKVEYTEGGTTKTKEYQTKNVYSFIKGNIDGRVMINYSPNVFSDTSNYLMAMKLSQIPKAIYDSGLIITPQWVTFDGTTVSGTSRNLKEEQETGTTTTPLTAGLYALDYADMAANYVTGKYGEAIKTRHKNGAITVLGGYDFGSNDFTISCWVKVPNLSGAGSGSNSYLFGINHPEANEGFSIQIKNNGGLRLKIEGNSAATSVSVCKTNTWMHLALVRENGTMKVYADGVILKNSNGEEMTYSVTGNYGKANLAFGANAGWSKDYQNNDVCFDDIRVYGAPLTAEEVATIVNNTDNATDETTGTVTFSPAPVAHVTYDDYAVTNTGTNTAITANLYKIDSSKKFVRATEFVASDGVPVGGTASSVIGKYGRALQTNHRTGAATVLDGYNFGSGDFTISVWFKGPDISGFSSGSNNYLFGVCPPDTTGNTNGVYEGFSIQLNKNKELRMNVPGQTAAKKPKANTYAANTWLHLALVRSGDTFYVYADGSLVNGEAGYALPAGYNFGAAKLAFGSYDNWKNSYQSTTVCFDDIQVYDKALDSTDIGNIKNNKTLTASVEPVAHVTYDDGIVANTGTDSTIKAGLYKLSALNASAAPNDFIECNSETGIDGTVGGATVTSHRYGPYTVLNGYNFGTDDFTISTWFNVPGKISELSSGSGTYLFGISQPDASNGFSICFKKSGEIRFRLNGNNQSPAAKVNLTQGTWNQITLSRKDDSYTIYFNGVSAGTWTTTSTLDFGTAQLAFGGYYGNANNYHGNTMYYDEINVYTAALDQDMITKYATKYLTTE